MYTLHKSAVLRLAYGRTHILLTGDAQAEAEDNMLASGADLSADALKVGHHGTANATGDAWLARVRPRLAAISCGAHNPFGHPSPATLARLAAHGATTDGTACDGETVRAVVVGQAAPAKNTWLQFSVKCFPPWEHFLHHFC